MRENFIGVRFLRRVALVAVVSWGIVGCRTAPAPAPPIRQAIWVTRWDYQTESDVRVIVERCADAGFDTVFFQVRGNGTTFYPSATEPWAEEFGFKAPDPYFDPLRVACVEAEKRQVALHAWVNAVPGWRGEQPPSDPDQLYHRHPDWFLYDQSGQRQPLQPRYYVALNPCLPEVRAHIAEVCADIVRRYEVAGIHLDYIRFLEKDPQRDYPRDARSVELYLAETGQAPDEDSERWSQWKRDSVSRLVKEIGVSVRRAQPQVQLSTAVFRTPEIARDQVFQDWPAWVVGGQVDAVIPMQYDSDDERFASRSRECRQVTRGSHLVMGLGVYKHEDPRQTVRQIQKARELGCDGYSLFAYASFYPSPGDALDENPPSPELRRQRREVIFPVVRSGRRH